MLVRRVLCAKVVGATSSKGCQYSLAGFVEATFGGYEAIAGSDLLEHGVKAVRAALGRHVPVRLRTLAVVVAACRRLARPRDVVGCTTSTRTHVSATSAAPSSLTSPSTSSSEMHMYNIMFTVEPT